MPVRDPARREATIEILAKIAPRWRAALESLVFFNPRQHTVRGGLEAAIAKYGTIAILDRDGSLTLRVEKVPESQSLFACLPDGRPAGCIVYCRDEPHRFLVLHVAVDPEFAGGGTHSQGNVLMRLLATVLQVSKRVRGVQRVEFLYGATGGRALRVR